MWGAQGFVLSLASTPAHFLPTRYSCPAAPCGVRVWLVGGCDLLESIFNYNWIISPNRGEIVEHVWKAQARIGSTTSEIPEINSPNVFGSYFLRTIHSSGNSLSVCIRCCILVIGDSDPEMTRQFHVINVVVSWKGFPKNHGKQESIFLRKASFTKA